MKKSIAWWLLVFSISALAFDTIGTESGTGTNQTAACKSARNSAENKAQISVQINSRPSSKLKPYIGSCQCSESRSGLYECIVTWRVE